MDVMPPVRRAWLAALALGVGACVLAPAALAGAAVARLSGSGEGGDVAPARTFAGDHAWRAARERRYEALQAQASVPATMSLTLRTQAFYFDVYDDPGPPNACCDGLVEAPATPPNATDIQVIVDYQNAAHASLFKETVWADCWILPSLPATPVATFASIAGPEYPTATHADVTASGVETTDARVSIEATWTAHGMLGLERWYQLRVTNDATYTVVGAGASAWEERGPTGSGVFWNALEPADFYQQRLAPGESVNINLYGARPTTIPEWAVIAYSEALKAPPTDIVYRFYNRGMGTHFYTISPTERDFVIARLGGIYTYEGAAYHAYAHNEVNTLELHRFYNRKTGTHFYTADPVEREWVKANLGWLYTYEGQAYAICDSGGKATLQMYRFYNKRTGTHFFTADTSERDSVIARLGWLYEYEGPVFTVPKP